MATKNGEIIDANHALLEILGSPSIEATKAINVLKFPPLVQNSYADKFNQCVKGGITIEFEMDYKSKWEKKTTLHSFLVPLKDIEGNVSNVYTLIEDITERKRSERIQNIIFKISNAVNATENLEQLISFTRHELGKIIDTSNFYLALYDEQTNSLSLPFFKDSFDNFDSFPAEKTITHYVIKQQKSLLADTKVIRALLDSGEVGRFGTDCLIWLGVPLKVNERIIGVLAVQSYTDEHAFAESDQKMLEFISDQISVAIYRKKAEEDLKEAKEKAEESDRLKSAFLANMSHEIRTPMNGILGFSDLLKQPGLSGEERRTFIDVIERAGQRMLSIINDIVDISKIESGQMSAVYSKVNINDQLNFIFDFFKTESSKKGIELQMNLALSNDEATIFVDGDKLYAVLMNLTKNASKYTRHGRIEIGYSLKEPSKEFLEFYVKDTGIGIKNERQDAIFERFIQADINDKMALQGAGLGLAISKAFVEMMGGKIGVESDFGKGSTFYFTIPYQQVKA
ncbi:MAG: GAF domain-containing protein [Bacteroidales bacterium]|nr:GAF domain-containing protein [Bacteroidales bacterium]